MTGPAQRPSPQVVLESEYHSGEPCDCYPPDRDRPAQECVVWAREILHALTKAGFTLVPTDDRMPKQCPKCMQWTVYDGWDHTHATGLGIGSCRATNDPSRVPSCADLAAPICGECEDCQPAQDGPSGGAS